MTARAQLAGAFSAAQAPGRPVGDRDGPTYPEEGRGTLCVSSQVGCTLTCSFCHTGTQKLCAHLTAPKEVLAQLLIARDRLGDFPERDTPDGAICAGGRTQGHQCRHDGHGRTALQFREREEGPADWPPMATG